MFNPEDLKNQNGGYWGEHPDYPWQDWMGEVVNSDTRLGYWEWVADKLEDEVYPECHIMP